jgi:N6-L-threonylcarbamoyladenine synthase
VRVLGIESSCDETGIAVVEDGRRILVNRVLSQVPLHERFGGVVPEIASRAHVEAITRMLEAALAEAGIPAPPAGGLDGIAVAWRPGLVGSLLVGVTAAKCLALAWDVPLVGVDHVHAHVYSSVLRSKPPFEPPREGLFPAVALVVSGGHTALYRSSSWTAHAMIGTTQDDAVGEAFDKAAAILGLGYPGGPVISRAAEGGDPKSSQFPRSLLEPDSLDFSFSGIKTAVLYHARGQNSSRGSPLRADLNVADVAAAFEEAVVDVLVEKLRRAVRREAVRTAILAGGVAANRRLRARLKAFADREGVTMLFPDLALCTDNGAMIAGLGYHMLKAGVRDDLSLDAHPMTVR